MWKEHLFWLLIVGIVLLGNSKASGEGDVLMCSFASWAVWRSSESMFYANFVPADLCTHIVYSYIGINENSHKVYSRDPVADYPTGPLTSDQKGYDNIKRLMSLKKRNPRLKIITSIGGWSEGSNKFAAVVESPVRRKVFVESVKEYIIEHGFDGVDIDWQYPAERGGPPRDKYKLNTIIKDLREGLPSDKLVTIHVAGSKLYLDVSYDLKNISEYVDFVGLSAYRYNPPSERLSGPNSPLNGPNPRHQMNVEYSLEYALNTGVPRSKLLLGFSTFGHTFVLKYPTEEGNFFYKPSIDTFPGPWSQESGFIGYNEICHLIKGDADWKQSWDDDTSTPYIFKNSKELVTYENEESYKAKLKLIGRKGLAGATVYSLDTDDFTGKCTGKKYPLTSVVKEFLQKPPQAYYWQPYDISLDVRIADENGKMIACYVESWSTWRPNQGKFHAGHVDPFLCSHIIYSFMGMDAATYEVVSRDPKSDFYYPNIPEQQWGNLAHLVSLKQKNPKLKVMVCIGGWSEGSEKYSLMAGNGDTRKKFVTNVHKFLSEHNLDGVDLDWEYPTERGGNADDRINFVELLEDLKAELSPKYIVSVQLHGKRYLIDSGYDVKAISDTVDFINLAAYHYTGPWDQLTAPNSPLKSDNDLNVESSVKYMLEQGADPTKILLGLSTFGHAYIVDSIPHDKRYLNRKASKSFNGQWSNEEGFIGFNEICWELTRLTTWQGDASPWTEAWDEASSTPYAYLEDKFISYDNEKSIKEKMKLVRTHNLGGAMIFYLDTDDFRGSCYGRRYPLVSTVKAILTEDVDNKGGSIIPSIVIGNED